MRFPLRRSAGPLLLAAVLASTAASVGVAHAEGPGYGGTADALSVSWVEADAETVASAVTPVGGRGAAAIVRTDGQPSLAHDGLLLQVNGLGFRARSEVVIRVGADQPVASRSDTSGSLDVAIDPALLGGTQPGLSIVAIGRAPSGTAVTLYGSVPPQPAGTGPMTLVPWLALSAALAGLALWARRRHRSPGSVA